MNNSNRFSTTIITLLFIIPLSAQTKLSEIFSMPQFGGYFIGRYMYTDSENSQTNGGFDLRMVRLYVEGKMLTDWKYRVQLEASGAPGVDKGIRLLDAYGEWNKYPEFTIRFGQMKRPFSFESPYHPWNVGWGNFSQVIQKLTGFSDRVGEHSSGGRDAGIVFLGDLFPTPTHRLFHYQIGIFNGQGINHSDANKNKDLIGGVWISPIKPLQIGAFGWTGRYTADQKKANRNRMAFGLKYEDEWTVRTEYITSQGGKIFDTRYAEKADGWYATVGIPFARKFKAYGIWDVYRDEKTSDTQNSNYAVALNYKLYKDLMLQATYYYTHASNATYTQHNEREINKTHYNTVQMQLYIRF